MARTTTRLVAVLLAACSAPRDPVPPAPRPWFPVGHFAVPLPAPAGWHVDSYGTSDGFALHVDGGRSPYSRLEIRPGCNGTCRHDLLARQIAENAAHLGEADATGGCRVRWVRPLGELRPGAWAFAVERVGIACAATAFVEVDYTEPGEDTYLECQASLYGRDVALVPAVLEHCSKLAYRRGPGSDPLDELFHHQVPMLGDRVAIPALEGWQFDSWIDNNGFVDAEVRMASRISISDAFVRRHLCRGACEDDIAAMRRRFHDAETELPAFPEIAPNRWIERFDDRRMIRIFGAALSPSKRGYLTCETDLKLEDTQAADRLEAFCRDVLARW